MKSAKPNNRKKVNLKPKDLTPNKDPRAGGKKFSRPRPDGLNYNHNEMFLAERNIAVKSSQRSNGKKINLKLKDLTPDKNPRGGGKKFSRPSPDGLTVNHNEMFLAEKNITVKPLKGRSGKKINLNVKDLTAKKDPNGGGKKFSRPSRDGTDLNHNEMFLAERNVTMKSKRSHGKKINLNLKDLTANKDLRGGIRVVTTWAGQNWGGVSVP